MSEGSLFLSYNAVERQTVSRVNDRLTQVGVSTFFDRTSLLPGLSWMTAISTALGRARAVAVFLGSTGLGPTQIREIEIAFIEQRRRPADSYPIIPVLLDGADPDSIPAFLAVYTAIDLRHSNLEHGLDQLATAARAGIRERSDPTSVRPYRGLHSFREEDYPFFFGREVFAKQLLTATAGHRVVTLVGSSGSGKSSLVTAGLLPLLRAHASADGLWDYLRFVPGGSPLEGIAASVLSALQPEIDPLDRYERLLDLSDQLRTRGRLDLLVHGLIQRSGASRFLIVVDPFEELFTLAAAPERQHFIQLMLECLKNPLVTLLICVRSDFFSHLTDDRNLNSLLSEGLVSLGPMGPEDLRRAIVEPARKMGVEFEPGVVERMLEHLDGQPGGLPLLQFALEQMWEQQRHGRLTADAYEKLGMPATPLQPARPGLLGAVGKEAERVFSSLDAASQSAVLRVFSRLIRLNVSPEDGPDTRQRAKWNDLTPDEQRVADVFVARRLLVKSRQARVGDNHPTETLELAHEALIRHWDRLHRHLHSDERDFLTWRQRVDLRIADWREAKEDPGALFSGSLLDEAKKWRAQRPDQLTSEQIRFIESGVKAGRRSAAKFAAAAGLAILATTFALHAKFAPAALVGPSAEQLSADFVGVASAPVASEFLIGLHDSGHVSNATTIVETLDRPAVSAPYIEHLTRRGRTDEARVIFDRMSRRAQTPSDVLTLVSLGESEHGLLILLQMDHATRLRTLDLLATSGRARLAMQLLEAALSVRHLNAAQLADLAEKATQVPGARALAAELAVKSLQTIEEVGHLDKTSTCSRLAHVFVHAERPEEAHTAVDRALHYAGVDGVLSFDELITIGAAAARANHPKVLATVSDKALRIKSATGSLVGGDDLGRLAGLLLLAGRATEARTVLTDSFRRREATAEFVKAATSIAGLAMFPLIREASRAALPRPTAGDIGWAELNMFLTARDRDPEVADTALFKAWEAALQSEEGYDSPLSTVARQALGISERDPTRFLRIFRQVPSPLRAYRNRGLCIMAAAFAAAGALPEFKNHYIAGECDDPDAILRAAGRQPLVRVQIENSDGGLSWTEFSAARAMGRTQRTVDDYSDQRIIITAISSSVDEIREMAAAQIYRARLNADPQTFLIPPPLIRLFPSRFGSGVEATLILASNSRTVTDRVVTQWPAWAEHESSEPDRTRLLRLINLAFELGEAGLTIAARGATEEALHVFESQRIPADDVLRVSAVTAMLVAWLGDHHRAEHLLEHARVRKSARSLPSEGPFDISPFAAFMDSIADVPVATPDSGDLEASFRLVERLGREAPRPLMMAVMLDGLVSRGKLTEADELAENLRGIIDSKVLDALSESRIYLTLSNYWAARGERQKAAWAASRCGRRDDSLHAYAQLLPSRNTRGETPNTGPALERHRHDRKDGVQSGRRRGLP